MTSHTAILKEAGVAVKGVSPEVCKCPLCEQEMSIVLDPFSSGAGRWLWCVGCAFYGDSMDLLKQMRKEKSMQDTIRRAEAFGYISSGGFLTRDAIKNYITKFHEGRAYLQEVWNALRASSSSRVSDGEVVDCLHHHKLWATYNSLGARVLRMIGSARKTEVNFLFRKKILPKSGFSTSVIFNMQDVPGRTCGFLFVSNNLKSFYAIPEPLMGREEAGLAFLENLQAKEDVVFAFDDPIATARIHQKRFLESNYMAKAITYMEGTKAAWKSVNANKVVFCPSEIDWKVFYHAKQVNGGHIVASCDKLNSRSSGAYLRLLERSAKPWKEVFAHWVLDEERSEAQVFEAVMKLTLTPKERIEIMDTVEPRLRDRVQARLGEQNTVKTITTNKKPIVEKKEGWFLSTTKGEELLCDAPFSVNKIVIDMKTQKVYWVGVIRYAGASIEYSVPYDEIENSPNVWLSKTVIKTGLGSPIIQRQIYKDLPLIARQFSEPQTVTIDRRLGLDETTGQIWFPQFVLNDGEFKPAPLAVNTGEPGSKIQIPDTKNIFTFADSLVTETEPTLNAYIAASTALIAGLLSPLGGWLRKPIGVIGSRTGGAGKLCRRLVENFDLKTMQLSTGSRKDIDYIFEKTKEYGWYVYVDTATSGLISSWPTDNLQPVVVVLSPLEAAALTLTNHWVLIHAENAHTDVALPGTSAALSYLADLQRREYGIPCSNLHQSIVTDFCRWWALGLNHNTDALVAASNMQILEARSAGVGFVDLCCRLRRQGNFNVQYISFVDDATGAVIPSVIEAQKRAAILFDEAAGKVYVSREQLVRAMAREKLPFCTFEEVERDLFNSNVLVRQSRFLDGWIISSSYWMAAEKIFFTQK